MRNQDLDKDIIAVVEPFPTVNQMPWMVACRARAKQRGDRLLDMGDDLRQAWRQLVDEDRREMLVRRGQFKRVAPRVLRVSHAHTVSRSVPQLALPLVLMP